MNCLLLTILGVIWFGYLFSFVSGFNPQLMLLTEFLIYNELAEKSTGGADSMVMAFHNVELHHPIWRSPPKTWLSDLETANLLQWEVSLLVFHPTIIISLKEKYNNPQKLSFLINCRDYIMWPYLNPPESPVNIGWLIAWM